LSSLLVILVLAEIYLTSLIVFTSTFLTFKGVPIEYANAAVAVMMTMSVLGTFFVGSISDRYGERKTLFGVMVMIFTLSLAIFSFQSTSNVIYLILLICLLGLPILAVTPPIFSLISSRIALKDQTIVFGILLSIAWGIGGLFPYLVGSIADIYGIQIIFGIAAFAAFLSIIIIIMKIKN
jgi:FSR family fosmidomycin resistance protein-like MFS transporter